MKVDIEVYKEYGDPYWAQAKYLVHGKDDVLWTSSLDEALDFIKSSLIDDTPENKSPAGGGSQPYKCASCPNFHERGHGCDTPEEIKDPDNAGIRWDDWAKEVTTAINKLNRERKE